MSQVDIKQVIRYKFNGIEYDSLEAVKDAVENKIGEEIIDKIVKSAPAPSPYFPIKLALLELFCEPKMRELIFHYLDVEYEDFSDLDNDGDPKVKNILDLNRKKK